MSVKLFIRRDSDITTWLKNVYNDRRAHWNRLFLNLTCLRAPQSNFGNLHIAIMVVGKYEIWV